MKYFVLFSLFCSLNTFTSDCPRKQNAITHVHIENTSNELVSCWFSAYNNSPVLAAQHLSINPKDTVNIKTILGTNITLYHVSNNKKECFADLTVTSGYKDIRITPTFAVQKKFRNGSWV